MPPVVKIRTCNEFIKDDQFSLKICGGLFTEGRCQNLYRHIGKYKTGWCAKNWCEGANAKDWKGNPAPTCQSWDTCPCSCHTMYDTIFRESGLPREVVNHSEWRPPKGLFWMPSAEERIAMYALSRPHTTDAPTVVESPLPEAIPATIRHSFTVTASGRAARGELESWVKEQCDIWIVEKDGNLCTPAFLADEIGRVQGIKPPSVGAISAVFDRWVKLDFAIVSKKPTRFEGYTSNGITLGLEGCKDRAKRTKRSAEAAAGRRMR